jgi:ATP-dependent DNA helicase RecG
MEIRSKFQSFLTLDYIVNESENKMFDRKSSKVKATDLAPIISAFANADGGTVVIGISDKSREIEGIDGIGSDCINNLIAAPKDVCVPMPRYREGLRRFIDSKGLLSPE